MKTTFVKWLSMTLALLMLASFVVACGGGSVPADTTGDTQGVTDEGATTGEDATSADTMSETQPEAETQGAVDTDADTSADTEAETDAEDASTRINEPTDAAHVTFYDSKRPRLNQIFTYPNQCSAEIAMDETYGSVLKLSTKAVRPTPLLPSITVNI